MPNISIVVAVDKKFGIAKDGDIPWNIKEDMQHFVELTSNKTVIMGSKTYFSIKKRPLKKRKNVIVSYSRHEYMNSDNVLFMDLENVIDYINNHKRCEDIVIIGGAQMFKLLSSFVDEIYMTYIEKDYKCDLFFNFEDYESFYLAHCSEVFTSASENADFKYMHFIKQESLLHPDRVYLNLAKDILKNGEMREDRTGTGTISLFGKQLTFDISKNIPLLTTKFIPWKQVIKELLWFLKGQTDANILMKDNIKIWNGNSTRAFLDKRGLNHYDEGDIGPMYGFQLRHFGAEYKGCKFDYTNQGIDQFDHVIHLLKTDPFSRRIIMTTYNVTDLEKGCLHPCHGLVIQFFVSNNNELSCHMYQRSVDVFLGLTWNILSYTALTYLIAKKVGMKPKNLVISTGDTHIYKDHIKAITTQINRIPLPNPILSINDSVIDKDLKDITIDDFDIKGYVYHPSIPAAMSI